MSFVILAWYKKYQPSEWKRRKGLPKTCPQEHLWSVNRPPPLTHVIATRAFYNTRSFNKTKSLHTYSAAFAFLATAFYSQAWANWITLKEGSIIVSPLSTNHTKSNHVHNQWSSRRTKQNTKQRLLMNNRTSTADRMNSSISPVTYYLRMQRQRQVLLWV